MAKRKPRNRNRSKPIPKANGSDLLLMSHTSQAPRHCDEYDIEFSDNHFDVKQVLQLYDNDALLQQAIDTPVDDALSTWRKNAPQYDSELGLKRVFILAAKKARIHRQVAIVPIMVDGEDSFIPLSRPLDDALETGDVTITRIHVIDNITPSEEIDKNIASESFGKPKSYLIGEKPVHPSRIIIVRGSAGNKSASESFLYYFKKFHEAYGEMIQGSVESNMWALGTDLDAVKEAMIAAEELGIDKNEYKDAIEKRLSNFRGAVSDSRGAYIYDKAKEEIKRHPVTNLSDLVKTVDKALDVLCAAVNIVPSRFIGKSTGSLNSSNKSDLMNMVMMAENFRAQFVEPPLSEFDAMWSKINQSEQAVIEWNPTKIEEILSDGASVE